MYYLRKWVNKAALVTSVSPAINKFIKEDFKVSSKLFTNGYNSLLLKQTTEVKNSLLMIRHFGTIYNHQDFSLILKGILNLIKSGRTLVRFELIGSNNGLVEQKIKNQIPREYLRIISNKLPQQEMYQQLKIPT
jgi:hypothetical protein